MKWVNLKRIMLGNRSLVCLVCIDDSIYTKLFHGEKKIQIVIKSEWESKSRGLTRTGPERIFCSDDNVLYFDNYSDTQTGTCQNLSNEVLKIYIFRCIPFFKNSTTKWRTPAIIGTVKYL